MKRIVFCILLFLCSSYVALAQTYDDSNSLSRVALVFYYMDKDGFLQKKENVNLLKVSYVTNIYGYNKKSHELYLATDRANVIVTVNDELHKILKKSKSIPQLKENELIAESQKVSQQLAEDINLLNLAWQQHIADSIETARQDSIRQAREDSLRIIAEKEKEIEYRKNHRWFMIPTLQTNLYCDICEKTIKTEDSLFCFSLKSDTVYWKDFEIGKLTTIYDEVHAAKIPYELKLTSEYQYHYKIFKDSLETSITPMNLEIARAMDMDGFLNYLSELKKEAPNGFFLDWNWSSEYSSIEFSFKYMNTNKNTIKYIEVFFVVTNDVGDVRKTGSFKGTGPLEQWESATWSWDHSSYYVAGDASKMSISKVIITYMNGSKVTIPKNKLVFD